MKEFWPLRTSDAEKSQHAASWGASLKEAPQTHFRLATRALAALLTVQCVWLLLSQLSRPGIAQLPADPQSATAAAPDRSTAQRAAAIGAVRGNLWAETAYTYANLLWQPPGAQPAAAQDLRDARANLGRALGNAPHQSAAWLLLAGLDFRYPSPGLSGPAALKMSYYTAPTDPALLAMRFRIAAHSDFVDDFEMRQFITRDLRLLLARQDRSAITAGYDGASPAGKHFIEQALNDINPAAAKWLRQSVAKPSIPN